MSYATWNDYTVYLLNDVVQYYENQLIYRCILSSATLPNKNQIPSTPGSIYWKLVGSSNVNPTAVGISPPLPPLQYTPLPETMLCWSGTQAEYYLSGPIRMIKMTFGNGTVNAYVSDSNGSLYDWAHWTPFLSGVKYGGGSYFYDGGEGLIAIKQFPQPLLGDGKYQILLIHNSLGVGVGGL